MKNLLLFLSLLLFSCSDNVFNPTQEPEQGSLNRNTTPSNSASVITLQSIFDASTSRGEYDKYLVLEKGVTYIGGLGVYEGNVFIEGNGSIINLQNGTGIWVYGDDIVPANVDMEYLTVMNGEWYGVFYGGTSTGNITNCNFINNGYGIQLYDYAELNIKNSNFINNTIYGLVVVNTTPSCNISYSNAWGNGEGDWAENTPG